MKIAWSAGASGRWGWLATTFILAVALLIASWANYKSARDATSTLHRGQGDNLSFAVRDALRRKQGIMSEQDLETILSERDSQGLRYVALVDDLGQITVSVGTPAAEPLVHPPSQGDETGPTLVTVGSRVRMFLWRRPRPPPGSPDAEPSAPAADSRPGVILEFEPAVASQLVARAARSLVFALVAAAVMVLAAMIFWRISLRHEQAQRRLEDERRLSLLGEMSAVLAHEIRNPLASLKGHAQLLAERLPPRSPDRHKAERVVSEASRLEALTNDLLDFARSGPLDKAPVDPGDLLRACAEEVAPGGFDLKLEDAPEQWYTDRRRLGQALTNLLQNAREASPQDLRPVAEISTDNGRLVFTIRDHGDGLPKGAGDRIFDPFFTTRASGTGLGLAVARRIVMLHGGDLTAENHPEGGAVFRIVLPEEKR